MRDVGSDPRVVRGRRGRETLGTRDRKKVKRGSIRLNIHDSGVCFERVCMTIEDSRRSSYVRRGTIRDLGAYCTAGFFKDIRLGTSLRHPRNEDVCHSTVFKQPQARPKNILSHIKSSESQVSLSWKNDANFSAAGYAELRILKENTGSELHHGACNADTYSSLTPHTGNKGIETGTSTNSTRTK